MVSQYGVIEIVVATEKTRMNIIETMSSINHALPFMSQEDQATCRKNAGSLRRTLSSMLNKLNGGDDVQRSFASNAFEQVKGKIGHAMYVLTFDELTSIQDALMEITEFADCSDLSDRTTTLFNEVDAKITQLRPNLVKELGCLAVIRWLPSCAEEMNPQHGLSYGKTMTITQASTKGLGKGRCQCGFEIVNR